MATVYSAGMDEGRADGLSHIAGLDGEAGEWLEEAAGLVLAAEQHLAGGRRGLAPALECIRRARSLLDTLVELSDEPSDRAVASE